MVIGETTDIRNLANQLLLETEETPETVDKEYPTCIYETAVDTPAHNSLSFNIETTTKENPKGSRSDSEVFKFVVLVFAIIGFIQVIKSVVNFAL